MLSNTSHHHVKLKLVFWEASNKPLLFPLLLFCCSCLFFHQVQIVQALQLWLTHQCYLAPAYCGRNATPGSPQDSGWVFS